MAARVAKAADATPGLEDRLRHARDLAHAHPAPDSHPDQKAVPTAGSQEGAKRGQLMAVPVNLIDDNPYNARRIYRPERVSQLAASIGAYGQDTPGIATIRHSRYLLAAGHYRLRSLRVLGKPTMDLMVHDGLTDRELFEYSYRENAERETQSALDNAMSWRDLLEKKLFASETELAEATGMSLPNVNKTLKILQLSEPVLDIVKEDPVLFAMSALYELTLYEAAAGQQPAIAMARLLQAGDAGRKEIQEARAQIEKPRARKRKETSRPYKIEKSGAYIGLLKVFGDSGRVVLDVVFSDPTSREQALVELKARFGVTE